ncbi:MAG: tetratricopeptide repeat protein [Chloroflexota bacterium]
MNQVLGEKPVTPSPQFIRTLVANLTYWRQQVDDISPGEAAALLLERPNLYRAIEFGLSLEETWLATAALALQFFPFIERWGDWVAWLPILERLWAGRQGSDLALYGRLLDQLGVLYRLNGRLAEAINAHLEEERIGRQLSDEYRLAHARLNLSEAYRLGRRYHEAEEAAQTALKGLLTLAAPPDKVGTAFAYLGSIAYARGQWTAAEKWFREAVALWRVVDQPLNLARTLKELALTLQAAGQVAEALAVYQETLAILVQTNSELDKVMVELNLGALYYSQERWAEAEAAFRRADSPYLRQSGLLNYQAMTANNLGNVFLMQGRLSEAESCLQGSLHLWRQLNSRVNLANTLGAMAEAQVAQNRLEQAHLHYDEAISLLRAFPDDAWAGRLLAKFRAARSQLDKQEGGKGV